MTTTDLETRLLEAIHSSDADVELLAHEVAASEDAQAYLVELVQMLAGISAESRAAARAEELLEHGLAIAAALEDERTAAAGAQQGATRGATRDPDGRR